MYKQTVVLAFVFLLVSCTSVPPKNNLAGTHGTAIEWYPGSVEQAFEEAKQSNRPILLYWGARWCPPCNELKSEVFSKPRAGELTRSLVPIYLDGDSRSAQEWGEKLQVSGYPTILVLDSNKNELTRISGSLSLAEFETALTSAVAAKQPFESILRKAAKGNASVPEWKLLSYYEWGDTQALAIKPEELITLRKAVVDQVPAALREERAKLSAELLRAAASYPEGKEKPLVLQRVRKQADTYLNAMLESKVNIRAARQVIMNYAPKIIGWLHPDAGPLRTGLKKKWLSAAKALQEDSSLSIDTQLWAHYPRVSIYELENPGDSIPDRIVLTIEEAVKEANKKAVTSFERKSVISSAAYLLRKVGKSSSARALLIGEVTKTDTPWYYQASLARLEKEQSNYKAALRWSDASVQSVKGRATRLQWLGSAIQLTVELDPDPEQERLQGHVRDFYAVLFSLGDGFSARNQKHLKRTANALSSKSVSKKVRTIAVGFSNRCRSLSGLKKDRCVNHFHSFGVQPSSSYLL